MAETKTNHFLTHGSFDLLDVTRLYASYGLTILLRNENRELWKQILHKCKYIPAAYTNMNIDFLFELQKGNGVAIQDLSAIIIWDNKPVAAWPLFISKSANEVCINCLDNRVLPPVIVDKCGISIEKKIIRACLDIVNQIALDNSINTWNSMESHGGGIGLSSWHTESMIRGAASSNQYELFIDMQLSIPEIKKQFRKSYKSLINAAQSLWTIGTLTNDTDESAWNEFKLLHAEVSGRKTRSDKTWAIHFADIQQQNSFLVYLRDATGRMVGAGFFNTTRDEGLYASGVYDRSLFDKPLGHIVQYYAIEELKKRGVSWYKLGPRSFSAQQPRPSEKEISIGEFKQGFATHTFPRFVLTHPVISVDNRSKPES